MVGQIVERVEEDVDGGAVLADDRVGGRPDHFVAGGLDAVVEERAAGRLATDERVDRRSDPGLGAEARTRRIRAPLAADQRLLEQALVSWRRSSGVSVAVLISHAIGVPGRAGR